MLAGKASYFKMSQQIKHSFAKWYVAEQKERGRDISLQGAKDILNVLRGSRRGRARYKKLHERWKAWAAEKNKRIVTNWQRAVRVKKNPRVLTRLQMGAKRTKLETKEKVSKRGKVIKHHEKKKRHK